MAKHNAVVEIAQRTTQHQRQARQQGLALAGRRFSQTTSTALTPEPAMAAKNQRCQPPASARKLKAAPVL